MRLVDELAPGPGPRARTRRQRSGPVAYEHELGELYCQGTSRCMKRYTSQGTLRFLSMPPTPSNMNLGYGLIGAFAFVYIGSAVSLST